MATTETAAASQKRDRRLGWSAYLVVAVMAFTSITVFWARDRGLDLTDEGFYLQLYAYPDAAPPNAAVSQFYHLVDMISGPFELGIIGYRIMGLLLLLMAGVVFGLAVYRFVAIRLPQYSVAMAPRAVGVSLVALTGLLGYSRAPLTVSYKTLSAVLVQLVMASTLWALSARRGNRFPTSVLLAGLGGALIPFLLYTKWPTVLAVSALVALVTFVTLGRGGWALMGVYGGAALVVFGLITSGVGPGPFSFSAMMDGSARIASGGYDPGTLVVQYALRLVSEVFLVLIEDPARLLALLVLFASGPILGLLGFRDRLPKWLLPVVAGILLLAEIPRAPYLDRYDSFKFVLAAVLALGLGAFVVRVMSTHRLPELWFTRWSSRGIQLGVFMVVLLGVPIAVAVGTNNPILVDSMYGGSGYGAVIVVGLAAFGTMAGDGSSIRHGLTLPVVALVVAAQILNGAVVDPRRLATSRLDQSVAVSDIPRLDGIRLDSSSARFLSESYRIITEDTDFESGDTVLAFALLPGLVYLIDGVSPGALWVLPVESGEQGQICDGMRSASSEVAATTLVIQNSDPSPQLAACLTELIPGYPEAFVEAGQVPIPDGYGAGTGLGTTLRVFELASL